MIKNIKMAKRVTHIPTPYKPYGNDNNPSTQEDNSKDGKVGEPI
jgi:hypothetical protein